MTTVGLPVKQNNFTSMTNEMLPCRQRFPISDAGMVIHGSLGCLNVIMNTAFILILRRCNRLHISMRILLANLAAYDVLSGAIVVASLVPLSLSMRCVFRYPMAVHLCMKIGSIMSAVGLSAMRYFTIRFPLRFPMTKVATGMIISISIIAMFLPIIFVLSTFRMTVKDVVLSIHWFYVLLYCSCIVIIMMTSFGTYRLTLSHIKRTMIRKPSIVSSFSRNYKVTKTVFINIGFFIAASLPLCVYILYIIHVDFDGTFGRNYNVTIFMSFFGWSELLGICNPVISIYSNRNLCRVFLGWFCYCNAKLRERANVMKMDELNIPIDLRRAKTLCT